jgi:hypothetical protein
MLSLWQISPLSFWLSRDFKYPPKHEDTNSVYCSQKDPKLEWSPFIKCEAKLETPCISVSLNSILCSQTYPKSCGTVPLITDYEMIKNLCCSKERKGEQVPCFATPFCSPSNQCSKSLYSPFSYPKALCKPGQPQEPVLTLKKTKSIFFMIFLQNWVQKTGLISFYCLLLYSRNCVTIILYSAKPLLPQFF